MEKKVYRIVSQEIVYSETYVRANDEEEAQEIAQELDLLYDYDQFDGEDWHIESVTELSDDALRLLHPNQIFGSEEN